MLRKISFTIGSVFFLFFGFLTAVAVTKQSSDEVPLIPRKILFGTPDKASPRISPDGKHLAYLAKNKNAVLNIWVRDLTQPGSEDVQITFQEKRSILRFMWQYDNQHILYSQDQDGDENSHLYQTSIATKETKDLTPYQGVKASAIAYSHLYPDEILVQMNRRDKTLFDVYRINLKTGETILDTENQDQATKWEADHHLQVRALQAVTKNGGSLIRVRDDVQAPWRDLLTLAPEETGGIVLFSPDNQSLYLMTSLGKNTNHLLKVDLATGEKTSIAEDPQYDIGGGMVHPTTNEIQALQVDRERPEWIVLDKRLTKDFDRINQDDGRSFNVISRDLLDENWVIAKGSPQDPIEYFLYNRKTGKFDFLFAAQPDIELYSLRPTKPISFMARDGMKLFGYLTLPAGEKQQNLPSVILVHGGPHSRDSWGFNPVVQWLANRGYAVLQVNFRGSTGYGKEYKNAGNREWGRKMHTDLLDGKKWLIDQEYSDPNKIALYGGSYGGYATLVGLAFTPDEFCCGVDMVGPSNLITLLESLPPYWSPEKEKMYLMIGNLETEKEFLKSRSPLFKASQIKKPLLIAQGANDPRVKQAESDQIVAEMKKHGLPVEYLLFSDEGHGFIQQENRLRFYAAAEKFLAKYLGGRSEPSIDEQR